MNISFYLPCTSLERTPAGSETLDGMALRDFLRQQHAINVASSFSSRWFYLKPWQYPHLVRERGKTLRHLPNTAPDIWLSCHGGETAPDLLGPYCCRHLSIPYIVYLPIQAGDGRSLKSWPGALLNRSALNAAELVFVNRRSDQYLLQRFLPEDRIHYLAPGVIPTQFNFDLVARRALRERWTAGERRIVMTTSMFRPGAKTIGVRKVINSCAELRQRGLDILLIIAGDGLERAQLEREGREKLLEDIIFLGKIPRLELYRYYSAADVFAFPGIQESRGMAYLEAQSAGLPVVAFADWGAADTVAHEQTGLLAPASRPELFTDYLEFILTRRDRRIAMREAAKIHIRTNHDVLTAYRSVQTILQEITARRQQTGAASRGR